MASDSKKKAVAKPTKTVSPKKTASPEKTVAPSVEKTVARKQKRAKPNAVQPPSLAQRLLERLPPLSSARRAAYASSFTDAQCDAWGTRTKAANVLAEGNRWASVASSALLKQPVLGYSAARLAWLCELLIQLDDAVASQKAGSGDHVRGARTAAVAVADKCRRELASLLYAVAGGRADLRHQVAERNESAQTPHVLASTLTGLVQLAIAFRRFPVLELLCEDAGLNEALLTRAYSAAELLTTANEKTFTAAREVDSAETNRIEGRVLREMKLLMTQFQMAKEMGQAVSVLAPSASIRHVLARGKADSEVEVEPGPTVSAHHGLEPIHALTDTGTHVVPQIHAV